ncbi:hypothetical protein E3N88_45032 [Mikania micrantha]|uniref:Uncharacterized protein n=1 Tax=Mikania micrantha TaxID=192012 RepID=A0A5N6LAY4_9ASTR|nr:hypothetical protein E3N88_45032 [Mikania micrantha]
MEKDRQRRSIGTYAPPWWERFRFKLKRTLVDDNDSSYFGAIYELKDAHPYAPNYVIAFRGTIKRFQTIYEDMKLEEDAFIMLSEWKPHLFVNPSDPICAEYIGYFQHRVKMDEIRMGDVERIAAKESIISLSSRAIGRESEPLHLLPTANLTVNDRLSVKKAHKIDQWWQEPFEGSTQLYKFDTDYPHH